MELDNRKIKEEDLCQAIVCKSNETVFEIANILKELKVRHLVVVDENDYPIGFVSQTDLIEKVLAEDKSPKEITVKEVMILDIVTVELGETYEKAYEKMYDIRTFSIPVVKDKKLVGVLDFNALVDCVEHCGVKK